MVLLFMLVLLVCIWCPYLTPALKLLAINNYCLQACETYFCTTANHYMLNIILHRVRRAILCKRTRFNKEVEIQHRKLKTGFHQNQFAKCYARQMCKVTVLVAGCSTVSKGRGRRSKHRWCGSSELRVDGGMLAKHVQRVPRGCVLDSNIPAFRRHNCLWRLHTAKYIRNITGTTTATNIFLMQW